MTRDINITDGPIIRGAHYSGSDKASALIIVSLVRCTEVATRPGRDGKRRAALYIILRTLVRHINKHFNFSVDSVIGNVLLVVGSERR